MLDPTILALYVAAGGDPDLTDPTVLQLYQALVASSAGAGGINYTEGAAPATPDAETVVAYAKTDGLLYSKDDAGLETLMSGGAGGGATELDYAEFTTAVSPTATTEATANTVVTGSAVAYDCSTPVWVEFFTESSRTDPTAGANLTLCLYDGGSSIGRLGAVTAPASGDDGKPVTLKRRLTPSAGSHTYSIRAYVSAGTAYVGAGAGGVGNYVPGYIRITKA